MPLPPLPHVAVGVRNEHVPESQHSPVLHWAPDASEHAEQHAEVSSHSSPGSTTPFPQLSLSATHVPDSQIPASPEPTTVHATPSSKSTPPLDAPRLRQDGSVGCESGSHAQRGVHGDEDCGMQKPWCSVLE